MYSRYLTDPQQTEPKFLNEDLEHLLIMRPDTIGEVLMLTPALRVLKEAIPYAEITLLTSSGGSQAASLLPWVDNIIVYPALWSDITESSLLDLRKDMAFIEQLREQRFSMALIFTGVSQSPWPSAYACYLAGIPHRVGFAEDANGSALSHFLMPPSADFHLVDRNLNLLEAIGIYDANNQMELRIPTEIETRVNELLNKMGVKQDAPCIVLAPGAEGAAPQYDPQHFAAAARILSAQTELQLIIVGSSDDVEAIQPVLQVANENLYGNVHSLVGKTTLPELAALIRGAHLTITNPSAAMHIAEVFQRPMVVIDPATDISSVWNARSTSTRILSREASCSLCPESGCIYGMNCLDIRPEEVAIAALELLGEQTFESTAHHILQDYRSEMSQI